MRAASPPDYHSMQRLQRHLCEDHPPAQHEAVTCSTCLEGFPSMLLGLWSVCNTIGQARTTWILEQSHLNPKFKY
jgi:hypothetical protein